MYDTLRIRSLEDENHKLKKDIEFLQNENNRMTDEIERWKFASGLERGGDPDGVRPEDAERFWSNAFSNLCPQCAETVSDTVTMRKDSRSSQNGGDLPIKKAWFESVHRR